MRLFGIINFGDRPHTSHETLKVLREMAEEACEEAVIETSRSIDHSAELVERAEREGFDTLVIGGGDGTINVLLNQVMGKKFTIGLLPLGTVNALARTLKIPQNPIEAMDVVLHGEVRKIDVGKVNERYFLCFASLGYDAAAVHSVQKKTKLLLGTLAFVLHGIGQLFHLHRLPKFRAQILPSGEKIRAYSAILSNINVYGGFKIFHDAKIDDGQMEIYFVNSNRVADYFLYAFTMVLMSWNLEKIFKNVKSRALQELTIIAKKPLHLQLDGEPVMLKDRRNLHFQVFKKKLDFVFPREDTPAK